MKISDRQQKATIVKLKFEIAVQSALDKVEKEEDFELSDVEFLQAMNSIIQTRLKYMLRYERHGNYETPAGLEK